MPGRLLLRKRYFRERDGICLETESENRSDLLLCGHGPDSAGRKSPRTRQSQDAFKSRTTLSGSGKAASSVRRCQGTSYHRSGWQDQGNQDYGWPPNLCELRRANVEGLDVRSGRHRNNDADGVHFPSLSQEFLQRLPIIHFPSRGQMVRVALGKPCVVKHDLGPGALFHKRKLRNGISAGIPAARSPHLDDSFVWYQLDLPSRDISAKQSESSSSLTADLCGRSVRRHTGLHRRTQVDHFVELFGVR